MKGSQPFFQHKNTCHWFGKGDHKSVVGAIMVGDYNRNHDTHLSCVLNPKLRTYQNECSKMLNNERGICMFRISTNKCYND